MIQSQSNEAPLSRSLLEDDEDDDDEDSDVIEGERVEAKSIINGIINGNVNGSVNANGRSNGQKMVMTVDPDDGNNSVSGRPPRRPLQAQIGGGNGLRTDAPASPPTASGGDKNSNHIDQVATPGNQTGDAQQSHNSDPRDWDHLYDVLPGCQGRLDLSIPCQEPLSFFPFFSRHHQERGSVVIQDPQHNPVPPGVYALPKSCEYCGNENTDDCVEGECQRPKLFFRKKRPPFCPKGPEWEPLTDYRIARTSKGGSKKHDADEMTASTTTGPGSSASASDKDSTKGNGHGSSFNTSSQKLSWMPGMFG